MKNIVILLCLTFIAFSEPVFALNQAPAPATQDTLIIKLRNRNQVFIIGKSLKNLAEYQRADTLKTWFFDDLERSFAANNFPETPSRVYYLINQNGKRRLKAEISGETEPVFDLDFEKKRLIQDLPPLHYTIYDLSQQVELHFFLEDTAVFAMVRNTNLTTAIQELKKDRKKLTGLTAYHLEQGGLGFEKRNPVRRTHFTMELICYVGGMLVGSTPSPLISFDLIYSLPHRPNTTASHFRVGFSYNSFVLTEFKDNQFRNINPGESWHFLLQANLGLETRNWFGITCGQFKTRNETGLPKNALKYGFQTNFNRDSFSFEAVELKDFKFKVGGHDQMYMFTYRRSIL